MSRPRPSTDQEDAPLLDHGNDHEQDEENQERTGLFARYNTSRPLTTLERVLAVIALLLMVTTAVFVGLFAGTESTLKKERARPEVTHTLTQTTTATATRTATVPGPAPTLPPTKSVCLTEDCVILSASIIQSLDTTADPCDDFWSFAVGGWTADHSIPADRGIYGQFNVVSDRNKKLLAKVIEAIPSELNESDADQSNLRKLKDVYDSCLDVDKLNELGIEPLEPLTDYITKTFAPFNINPLPEDKSFAAQESASESWTPDYEIPDRLRTAAEKTAILRANKLRGNFFEKRSGEQQVLAADADVVLFDKDRRDRITSTLAFLHARGVGSLFELVVEGDAGGDDPQVQSLWFYQAFGGLPSKEYYEEPALVDLYQQVVAGVLTEVAGEGALGKRNLAEDLETETADRWPWPWPWPGEDDDGKGGKDEPLADRMKRLAKQVVQFEGDLIRAGGDLELLFNPHYAYNPYSTEDVDAALAFLDLPAYLSAFAPRVFPTNITVTYPPYLAAVSKLVAKVPDHVLSAYFTLQLALTYGGELGPEVPLRQHLRRLQTTLTGVKADTEEDRQDVCLSNVDNVVGFIAGREFVREAFSPEAKADGEDIINSIVTAFSDKLPHIAWMDKKSAAAAQVKAKSLLAKVGYPLSPNTTDARSIRSWYSRLEIKSGDHFGNTLRSNVGETARAWGSVGRQRNRQSWLMNPQTVNAYYSPPDGEIVFPAGILQAPFYSREWPAFAKYGAFGAVAAHELTHAFDNSGAQYDERGRLRDWWTNETVAAFEKRAQCIADQYSQYYVLDAEGKKHYVNGNYTNGEDIGDSGLAQAYGAWRATLKDKDASKSAHLPGLAYSPEQLFFISYARIWATLTRPATAVSRVRTDPHSPPYWRVTGTLRNLPAFHDAFGCKRGDRMNPKAQCELW